MALVSLLPVPPGRTTCTLNVLKFIPLVVYKKVKTNRADPDRPAMTEKLLTGA